MSAGGPDARVDRLTSLLAADGIDAATVRKLLPVPFDEARAAASAVQQRLWLINQLRAQTSAYHLPIVLRLAGALDVAALRAALTAVVARHEIMRTTLAPAGGVPVQEIWPASAIDVPVVDVRIDAGGDADTDTVAAYRAEALRLACEPFDLGARYPWRVALLRAAAADHCLVFVFHHANFDGASIDVLLADLARAYSAALASRPDDAAPLPIQYAEFAAWQHVREAAGALDDDIAYWTQQLGGVRPLDLGGDRSPAAAVQSFEGGVVRRELDPALMRQLADVASAHEATRFTAGLATWAGWLHERTGEDDIVVATVAAGRTRAEFESLIGAFVNTVAVRLRAGGGQTFGALARQARQTTIDAVRHQHAPLERLLESLKAASGLPRTPIAQAAFVQPVERRIAPMPGLQITRILLDAPGAKTDLSLSLDGRGGSWAAALDYSTNRFSRRAAEQALDDFLRFFRSAVAAPAAPIAPARALPLTPAQMRVWLDQQRSPDVPLYNVAIAIDIDGVVDAGAFARAFEWLVESTDALRLGVSTMAGVPRQRVRDSIRGVTERVDLVGLSDDERAAWLKREAIRPFDLGGPLFRSVLAQRTPESSTWLFVQHHLITDGSSIRILCERLSQLYDSAREKRDGSVELSPSFADYAAMRQEPDGADDGWWIERFADVEPPRFFGVRPQKTSTAVTRTRVRFTPDIVTRFRAAAAAPGVPATQAAFLLCGAALVALLHRMTGETTIALGVPFHQRAQRRHRGVVGLLMDVVPVAVECSGADTLDDLVSRLGSALRAALRRSGSPPPQRVRERACDVLLNVQTTPLEVFCGHYATIDWVHSGHERESLTVQLHDLGARGMGFDIDTLDDVFDARQRTQTAERLVRVLDQCIDDRRTRIRDLRIGDDRERAEAIAASIGPVRADAYAQSAIGRILAAAHTRPDAIAIESGGARTTCAALADRVHRVAAGLARCRIGRGDVVGVCLERSAEFVEAILGTLAAGAAYLPLDPRAPRQRIDACVADAGARVVIVADESAPCAAQTVAIEALLRAPYRDALPTPTSGDLAYVIYTSGSTGAPKGVEVTHVALANYVAYAMDAFELTPDDRALQFAALTFDTAVEEIFPTLAAGATLVLRDDRMLASPQAFVARLAAERITVLNLPTSYWHQLAASAEAMPPSIRLTLIGGEALRADLVARWRQLAPGSRVLNGYGLTEGTVVTTFADLTAPSAADGPVSIGRPIWNAEAYVLDAVGMLAADDLAGELYIGGVGLARGYRGNAELTARGFVPHPFKPGQRLYRTGDRVRRRAGRLEYLGRLDEQVKVQGFRIDPGEIAACLHRHPSIADAVVVTEDVGDERRLAAYVVARDGLTVSAAEVRAHVRERLPEYMVPSALFVAPALPRTASGKLDRERLAAASTTLADAPDTQEPSTVTERIVASMWTELIRVPTPGARENFFDLGGHSLAAARLAARLQETFGVDVPLRTVFERPTIADLAAFIDRAGESKTVQGAVAAIPRVDRKRYRAAAGVEALP